MDIKKIIPHILAVLSFLAVAVLFFAPIAFSGKVLAQPDNEKARGMATEINHYIKTAGESPLWTNSAFGGMPSYQIYVEDTGNMTKPLVQSIFLWQGIEALWVYVFAAMFCMYLLLLAMKLDWRVAIFGALAYGVTTYHIDILEAGHSTKMMALALAPAVLAGVVQVFRGNILLGLGMTSVFTAMQIYVNHVQIVYYTFLLVGIYLLVQLINSFRHRGFLTLGKGWLIVGTAILIGVLGNFSRIWSTWEYGKETIRGKSELEAKKEKGDGLDKDYLFGWSYGVGESLTTLVPHYAGGGVGETFESTKLHKKVFNNLVQQMQQGGVSAQEAKGRANQQISSLFYTGDQPFVGTAVYFGAIVIFLAFLGAFLARGELKWWLLSGGLFMVSIAWGKNFFMNDVWYSVMPMFNKFRAVSQALGLGQLCFAALAALGLQKVFDADIATAKKWRAFYTALAACGVLLLLALMTAGTTGPNDKALAQQPELLRLLSEDRSDLVKGDVFRSFFFIALAAAALWAYLKGKLKPSYAVVFIAVAALADHWMVSARSISPDEYVTASSVKAPEPDETDKQILQDKDPHYRVMDFSRGGITGNAVTSSFHKSISGYHAAKLQIFQEMVDKYLSGGDVNKSMHILGMLNAKYIINQDGKVFPNDKACGNAWFVKQYESVPDADTELNALATLDPRSKAVVQQKYAAALNGLNIVPDSAASIRLVSYHPDRLQYQYTAATDQLAVFSEIYYPSSKGWNCYLNGTKIEGMTKVDYLLRGLRVPAGSNMALDMRFEPQSILTGNKVAIGASLLAILLFAIGLFFYFRSGRNSEDTSRLDDIIIEKATRAQNSVAETKNNIKKRRKL